LFRSRAGNASLEEIVMALKTRSDVFRASTAIKTDAIYKTSRLVSKLTGMPVQPNKAIVGRNAFSHESGIHQDGLLKEKTTYEIIRPEDVGFGETEYVLGKHSGRHAFSVRLKKLGYALADDELEKTFKRFKVLADKKKEIFDEDLAAIVEDELGQSVPKTYSIVSFKALCGNEVPPNATVRLKKSGAVKVGISEGDGPVDACYKAVDAITGIKGKLIDYQLRAVTKGKDAIGEVSLRYVSKGKEVSGRGASTDVVEASLKAYVDAINKLARKR
ncbi:MAG: alpha-isopropylmalate synthase regulatory domain-containing protein, partial [Candidatus Omnitrophica bacterium]|nr:alpha-isopropylmalate synthase regulatory domain-containing protein [Candidatus Omnitrophota bacterium]